MPSWEGWIKVELCSGEGPLYQRIIDEVRRRIAEGGLLPGERLPPTRDLARTLGADPNTVAHAYGILKAEGILEARRGDGTYVSAHLQGDAIAAAREERLGEIVRRAVAEAGKLGYGEQAIRAAFEARLAAGLSDPGERVLSFRGSHDTALDLLWTLAARREPRLRVRASSVGSFWGLVALERGEADLTGVHLLDADTGEYNLPWIRRVLVGRRVALLRLGGREQGLMYRTDGDLVFRSIEDLGEQGVRFVNRQRGSGTRVLLDDALKRLGVPPDRIAGYGREESTHSGVAAVVARGEADVGLGLASSARALGLGFTSLAHEQYDLVALRETLDSGALDPVRDALQSDEFRALLDATGGYDAARTGEIQLIDA